jgi:hypothetical protein
MMQLQSIHSLQLTKRRQNSSPIARDLGLAAAIDEMRTYKFVFADDGSVTGKEKDEMNVAIVV